MNQINYMSEERIIADIKSGKSVFENIRIEGGHTLFLHKIVVESDLVFRNCYFPNKLSFHEVVLKGSLEISNCCVVDSISFFNTSVHDSIKFENIKSENYRGEERSFQIEMEVSRFKRWLSIKKAQVSKFKTDQCAFSDHLWFKDSTIESLVVHGSDTREIDFSFSELGIKKCFTDDPVLAQMAMLAKLNVYVDKETAAKMLPENPIVNQISNYKLGDAPFLV